MAVKKTARQIRNEAHAREIQLASNRLFDAYDFDRVTVEDICSEAGVSKSTFYNLYRSKDDLAMVSTYASRYQYIEEHYAFDAGLSPNALMKVYFRVNFGYTLLRTREQVRQVYKGYLSTGNVLQDERCPYRDRMYEIIDYAIAQGKLRMALGRDDAWRLINDALLGCFIGWSAHITAEPGLDEQYMRILDGLADAFIDA